jgi:hypothetical protein
MHCVCCVSWPMGNTHVMNPRNEVSSLSFLVVYLLFGYFCSTTTCTSRRSEKHEAILTVVSAVAPSIYKYIFLYDIAPSLCSNIFAAESIRLRTKDLIVDSRAVIKSDPLGELATPNM